MRERTTITSSASPTVVEVRSNRGLLPAGAHVLFRGLGGWTAFLAWITILAQSCQSSDVPSPLLTAGGEYDTVGATIVEHASLPDDLPTWTIAEIPDLSIGRVEGDSPDVFGGVLAVVVTSTEDIVVADSRALELRAFDRTGDFLWRAGREGEGPGEFTRMAKLLLTPGDSLLVVERTPPRATIFDPAGGHVRTTTLRSPDPDRVRESDYHGVLSNGTIIATAATRDGSVIGRDYRRFLHALTYIGRDGEVLHRGPGFFDKIRYEERLVMQQPDGSSIPVTLLRSPAIAGEAVYAVHADRVAVGVQDRAEIAVYDSDARPVLVVRLPSRDIETNRERFIEHTVAAAESARVTVRQQTEVTAGWLPETLSGHGRILIDAAGLLWVEEFVPVYEDRRPDWWVFDAAGEFVARASFPDGFVPYHIDVDYVLGVMTDDFDVPYVEHRAISRQGL